MKAHATESIRNVAVIGHGHAGKTSLTEGLLFAAGETKRLGSPEAGTAHTDFGEDEHAQKISIRLGLAHFEQDGVKVNLLDAPGYGNFLFDAKIALSVAETALVVVDGVHGVEVQAERAWGFAEAVGTPARVIALNKMDRDNADFERAVADCQERFGREAVPVQVPIGRDHDFKGVVDILSGNAFVSSADGSAAVEVGPCPDELKADVDARREALIEMVAESSEKLMEAFLDAGTLSQEQLAGGLRRAVATGQIYPVCCASATTMVGIQALARVLAALAPSPSERSPRRAAEGDDERPCSDDAPVTLQVFKSILDPFAGRLSLVRAWAGKPSSDMTLCNTVRDHTEKLANLSLMQGKELVKIAEIHAGDIACLTKLKDTLTGDTLADAAAPIVLAPLEPPEAMMHFAVEAQDKGDEDKITAGLARLVEEDQQLSYHLDPQTHELIVSGAGERHVRAVMQRLKDRFKVETVLHPPRVPYKETITRTVSGSYRHKKQSGGAGQFAEVHAELKPLERGKGFEYDTSRIFGGAISQNFFPSIEKGVRQVLARGPLSGSEVVDVRCEVFDGKMHPVDSKDVAFQTAGRQLMRQLVLDAKPILLEPIMKLAITVPEESMGDVMSDLSSRRGRVQGMETDGARQEITAFVPLAEVLTYEAQLKSLTGGRGTFHMEFDHYDNVPAALQAEIREKHAATAQEDQDA